MNILSGMITELKSHKGISLVKIKTDEGLIFTSVVIESFETSDFIQKGKIVNILFKETEVMIAKDSILNVSVQNKIPCVIKSIQLGEILCQLNLAFMGKEINSIITRNAYEQLSLKTGDSVFALIKSNEVSISAHD